MLFLACEEPEVHYRTLHKSTRSQNSVSIYLRPSGLLRYVISWTGNKVSE